MTRTYVQRTEIEGFLARLSAAFARPGRVFLTGETTQVYEGWRRQTPRLEFGVEVDASNRAAFTEAVSGVQAAMGIEVLEESPGDVIPLPAGHAARARSIGRFGELQVDHFDPYSVAFRLIARGDEPDYHAVVAYLQHDWLTVDEMDALLADLLPRFTNETIQQDPAEFRRKYKGLLQMWRATQPQT